MFFKKKTNIETISHCYSRKGYCKIDYGDCFSLFASKHIQTIHMKRYLRYNQTVSPLGLCFGHKMDNGIIKFVGIRV